jgi:hypothetical protein
LFHRSCWKSNNRVDFTFLLNLFGLLQISEDLNYLNGFKQIAGKLIRITIPTGQNWLACFELAQPLGLVAHSLKETGEEGLMVWGGDGCHQIGGWGGGQSKSRS